MTFCLLSIGSNAPDAPEIMARTRQRICTLLNEAECSDIYSTKALNGHSPDYLNMVAAGTTELSASALTSLCKEIENENGRSPQSKQRGVVELDIDLVQYGSVVLRPTDLMRQYVRKGLLQLKRACVRP